MDQLLTEDWSGGDPFRTAFFNALSITFPLGEKFFIDSVRAFSKQIEDENLREDVRGFIAQEAQHHREHQKYNERLCELRGYDLAEMEARWSSRITWTGENASPIQRLAVTVAFEHLTALLADGILRSTSWFEGVDPRIVSLWKWHAVEETEHKAVAFDVYRAVGGDEARRCRMLRAVTLLLARDVARNMYEMLKVDGKHLDPRVWWSGLRFLFGRNGLVTRSVRGWRSFTRAGFHPWDHDNRELLREWVAEQPLASDDGRGPTGAKPAAAH